MKRLALRFFALFSILSLISAKTKNLMNKDKTSANTTKIPYSDTYDYYDHYDYDFSNGRRLTIKIPFSFVCFLFFLFVQQRKKTTTNFFSDGISNNAFFIGRFSRFAFDTKGSVLFENLHSLLRQLSGKFNDFIGIISIVGVGKIQNFKNY